MFTQQVSVPKKIQLAIFIVVIKGGKMQKAYSTAIVIFNILVRELAGKSISKVRLSNNTISQRIH